MGSAVLTDGETAVGAHDLDIQAGVGDGVSHLLPGTACGEHGEGVDKGLEAAGSHTGGNAGHVGLGDAHIEEALRAGFQEELGHGGTGQVSVEHHQLGILVGQLRQSHAVCVTSCNLFAHFLSPPVP